MPAAITDGDQDSGEEPLNRAISHLVEALEILDVVGDYPEAAAKLQSVVDLLSEARSS